ncbi:DUF748 domain-containing protein [bacterium]|nr:DUF748 domain-containing protein [bacterium]
MGWRISGLKSIFTKHRHFWLWFVIGGVALFCLALLLLPHGIRWGAQRWLRGQGLQTAIIKAVEFNPFSGRLVVYSAFSVQANDRRMNLGTCEVDLDWRPLMKRRLSISGFSIENVLIDVHQQPDGSFSIGGIVFKPQPSAPKTESKGRPWEISIGSIDLHNVSLTYREPRVQGKVDIYDLHFDPIDSARPELPTNFLLAMGLNGGKLNLNGAMRPFRQDQLVTASVRVAHLPLEWLGGLAQPQGVTGFGGEIGAKSDIKFANAGSGAVALDAVSTVTLRNLRARAPQGELGNVTLGWDGRVSMVGSGIKVAGNFHVADLKAKLAAQGLGIAQTEIGWRGEMTRDEKTGAVKVLGDVRSRGLKVDDMKTSSRLCALDEMAIQSTRVELGGTTETGNVWIGAGLRLKGLRADLAAQGMALEQKELGWKGTVRVAPKPANNVTVQGALTVNGFRLDDRKSSSTLVQLGSLAWPDANIKAGLGAAPVVNVSGQIKLADLKSRLAAQGLDVAQSALEWKGDVAYDQGKNSIKVVANITGDGLTVRDTKADRRLLGLKQWLVSNTSLDVDGLTSESRIALRGETRLTDLRARVPQQPYSIRQDSLDWKGTVHVAAGKATKVEHQGDVAIAGLTVEDRQKGLNVLDLGEFAVTGAKFKTPTDVVIKKIRLGSMRALERPLRKTAITSQTHALSVREVALSGLSYDGKSMIAESLQSSGFVCVLVRGANGAPELQEWSSAPATSASTKPTPAREAKAEEKKDSTPLHIKVGRIAFEGDNRLLIRDEAARPAVMMVFQPMNLSITGLDSTKPDQPSPLLLTTRAGKYANIKIEGTVSPFAALPTAALVSRIESVELPKFTPYTQQYIGYRLASGRLTLITDLNLSGGILKSKNDLAMNMFELERLRPDEMDALSSQLGYPVNTALAMLRDGNGDIKLSIPVDGDLRNPQVGIGGVIRKALLNGSTNSVRSAVQVIYAPLGAVVSVGGKLTGQGVMSFKPIVFAAGSRDLAPEAGKYLDQLAKTMQSRPGLRVSLAGYASPEDVPALPKRGDEPTTSTQGRRRVLGVFAKREKSEVEKAREAGTLPVETLTRLANRRASTARDYLVKANIKPERIFVRAAQIDQKQGAKPRVEISF